MIKEKQQSTAVPPFKLHPRVKFNSTFALPKCLNIPIEGMSEGNYDARLRINKAGE